MSDILNNAEELHNLYLARRSSKLVIGVILLVLAIIHFLLWGTYYEGSISLITNIIIGNLSALIPLVFFYLSRRRRSDNKLGQFLGLNVLFLGTLGLIGFIVSIFVIFLKSFRKQEPFHEWFDRMFQQNTTGYDLGYTGDAYVNGRDEKPEDLIPFIDVISVGNEEQKREAIAIIAKNFVPGFAPALKKALEDSSNSVRVQAATAIAKIENRFLRQSLKLSVRAKKNHKNASIILEQAKLYEDYALTGLLDTAREKSNIEKAISFYKEYLNFSQDDENAKFSIGKLLVRANKNKEAFDWLQDCINKGFDTKEVLGTYMQCIYNLKDFGKLRRVAKKYLPLSDADTSKISDIHTQNIKLWASPV